MSLIRIPCNNPSGCGVKFHFRGTKAACMLPKRDNPTSVALRYASNNIPSPSGIRYDNMEPEEYRENIEAIATEVMNDLTVMAHAETDPLAHRYKPTSEDDRAYGERLKRQFYEHHMSEMGIPKDARFTDPMADIVTEVKRQHGIIESQKVAAADEKLRALGFDKSAPEDFTPEDVQELYKRNGRLAQIREKLNYTGENPPAGSSQQYLQTFYANRSSLWREFETEIRSIGLQESKTKRDYRDKTPRVDDLVTLMLPKDVISGKMDV